ncbi:MULTISPECIES: molybdate ABC transporter permease subunit [unclassified Hydrogenobaculum]|uniref:molybdate ABC transporter permease subunit n=1 Tax=unclassified Hydrogenobaculum TaxID=2622382 RepID=UPI0001C50370|nr:MULTISPECIES: molybdate ABC transporter permease subunit [unclassified Hydrogenobaculum]AEF19321.1 molybdate ABC transporter, inner membrane subunit [Hydrogenobaculum sp. 3684]AEG46610.1 molybdate ABC transporter, inner membrane subunit [Hydrogenobaculum sp. SHO]AGG15254.1 molybdate ABC transporter, inner membrane subunit [Hydrogenobaculum sp. HO]AGH93553.1 molybdate ABC transporter, permease protein [Hydrogenobaculum sp. SN]
MIDYSPFLISFEVAISTTIVLGVVGIFISYFLAFSKSVLADIVEPFIMSPLVLPPTVLGFYIMYIFGLQSPLGRLLNNIGIHLLFNFNGLLLGSIIYSLPFAVSPVVSGFRSVPKSIIEASYTLGKSKFYTLLKVIIPNSKYSIISALVLVFSHTIGEFGVVLMVGGDIPGKTRTASIAIFDYVQELNYKQANITALILFAIAMSTLIFLQILKRFQER